MFRCDIESYFKVLARFGQLNFSHSCVSDLSHLICLHCVCARVFIVQECDLEPNNMVQSDWPVRRLLIQNVIIRRAYFLDSK